MKQIYEFLEILKSFHHSLDVERAFDLVFLCEKHHMPILLYSVFAFFKSAHSRRAGPAGPVIAAGISFAYFTYVRIVFKMIYLYISVLGETALFCDAFYSF